jgi:hypothetical protein
MGGVGGMLVPPNTRSVLLKGDVGEHLDVD